MKTHAEREKNMPAKPNTPPPKIQVNTGQNTLKTNCLAGAWGRNDGEDSIEGCKGDASHEAVYDELWSLRCCSNPACQEWAKGYVVRERNRNTVPTLRGALQGKIEL
ncbi:hypothetical protein ACFL3T_02050 [Patescibacteria group bacterium]